MLAQSSISMDASGIIFSDSKHVQFENMLGVWDGFVYLDSGECEDSAVIECLRTISGGKPPTEVLNGLRGTFFLAIFNANTSTGYCCVDNSGLYSAYRGSSAVSRSFLSLQHLESIAFPELDKLAMTEFLQLGHICFRETLTSKIRKIDFDEIVTIGPDGLKVGKFDRAILTGPQKYNDLLDATSALAESLRNRLVAIDLTGGFDSRLIACLMQHHGVEFESGLSGHWGHVDQKLGSEVAKALGVPFHFHEYQPDAIKDDLPELLLRLDGLCGSVATCHRLQGLTRDRVGRGVNICLKGQGGEMYKDFFWSQDFPFYRRHKSRIQLLHRLRIEMELLSPSVLTPEFHEHFLARRLKRIAALENYSLALNTQSYDHIYFRERIQSGSSRTTTSSQVTAMPNHSPLSEVWLSQIGFNAPRRLRAFSRVHRHYISRISEQAAAVLTTDGTSARAARSALLMESAGYVANKSRRLFRKLNQMALNRTPGLVVAINAEAEDVVCSTDIAMSALMTLKHHGIVQDHVEFGHISPRFRANFIVLGNYISQIKH